jgi:hypothetical protein
LIYFFRIVNAAMPAATAAMPAAAAVTAPGCAFAVVLALETTRLAALFPAATACLARVAVLLAFFVATRFALRAFVLVAFAARVADLAAFLTDRFTDLLTDFFLIAIEVLPGVSGVMRNDG